VFGRLFGSKDNRPAPAKGQMLVQCPACGASQYEPKLVISTNCRTCGVHLSVHRGKISASIVRNAPVSPRADPPALTPPPKRSLKPIESSGGRAQPLASPQPNLPGLAEPVAEGFGAFLQGSIQAKTEAPAGPTRAGGEKTQGTKTKRATHTERGSRREASAVGQARSAKTRESNLTPMPWDEARPAQRHRLPPQAKLPQASSPQAPREPTTLQRMREGEVYRRAYFKEALCFACNHSSTVNRSARQTNCPACGAVICLEDVEINLEIERCVQTRGDLLVRKRGELTCDLVECRDLRCHGVIHGDISASGDAIFANDGLIKGRIRCRRLVIDKGANTSFSQPVQANEAEINAKVTGDIECRGRLVIGKNGLVRGDVSAASVSIEPGGTLDGNIRIITPYHPSSRL
jgi:cytoskeletal protein CcmA (bactofilin family)